jgi:branched-chain amino acid transport system substrate-binding protein
MTTRSLAAVAALALLGTAAQAKDKVRITFVGPLTGGNSANGLGGRNSADLAVKLRNADPKTKYQYELVVLDDECKPDAGVQVATKAGSDRGIVAGVTHYCSVVAMATVDTYHRFGLPVIVWGAVLPDITYAHDFKEIHRVNGTMINQNDTNAEFMTKQGYKRFAVIHDTTDYGKGHNKYFSEALKKRGGEILGTFGVTADQQDFTAELTQIKGLNPQALYFGGLGWDWARSSTVPPESSPTISSRAWVRSPRVRWPSAKAHRWNVSPAGRRSWRSTRRPATPSRRRRTVLSPSPRRTSWSTPSRRWARIGRRSPASSGR